MNFKDVQEYLNTIPNINKGGCGIASLAMLLWIKKHKSEWSSKRILIVFGYYNVENWIVNDKIIKGEGEDLCPVPPSHCWLDIDGVGYDSEGAGVSDTCMDYHQCVSLEFLHYVVKRGKWNPRFDRQYCLDIEETLGIEFGLLIKELV